MNSIGHFLDKLLHFYARTDEATYQYYLEFAPNHYG